MNVKILKVFYGTDTLPYKDKARTIHFPIVGQSFIGVSNTTEIHFYFEQLGDSGANATYIASAKLPNGKKGYKLLTKVYDNEENEWYAKLQLSSFFTQAKGDLYISLRGYDGGAEIIYDSQAEIYKVEGDPIIQGTGSVKLAINYAVEYQQGSEDDEISLEDIYAEIGTKLAILSNDYMSVVDDISAFVGTSDFADYPNNHIFLDRTTKKFYQKLTDSTYQLYDFSNYYYEADASTTFSELANLGHAIIVKYGNAEYLMFSFNPTSNVYVFTIYNLLIGGEIYRSGSNGVGAYIEDETLFSAILTDAYKVKFVEQTSVPNIVYGTNNSGNQAAISVSVNVANSTVVKRGASGQIYARETPTDNTEVVRKEYVDSFAKDLEVNIDPTTFEMAFTLKDKNGNVLAEEEIDLPLESIIVSAEYYETYTYDETTYEKVLVIELATTDVPTIIPVGDLLDGLVNEGDLATAVAGLETKINKCVQQKTTTGNYAYTHNGSTEEETALDSSATANTIPIRDNSGNIQVGTPVNSGDATKKAYVDTFARTLECAINTTTYVMTFTLKDNGGNTLSTQTIDLPLETMVVNGSYDSDTESLVLELKNGSTISIPISDLISGLITNSDLATALASYYTKAQIDQMVAGFVFADVDDELSEVSDNPVENRVITIALKLKANTQDLLNGTLIPEKARTAINLLPVSSISGSVQTAPFINQGAATNNNDAQAEVDTGTLGQHLEKQGNTVVVNQLADITSKNGTASNTGDTIGTTISSINSIINHKYLFVFDLVVSDPTKIVSVRARYPFISDRYSTSATKKRYYLLGTATSTDCPQLQLIKDVAGSSDATYDYTNISVHDLTQWFNGDIPQDLLDNPDNFFRYYNGDLSSNTGTLVNSNGRYLVNGYQNIWDEQYEQGVYNQTTGVKNNGERLRCKNPIRVIPNREYYFYCGTNSGGYICFYDSQQNFISGKSQSRNTTFTTPSNCCYMTFNMYSEYGNGTTYNHDITISLYYEGEDYSKYVPYKAPAVYDTGNEELLKIPDSRDSVVDYKTPDGTIHHLINAKDLGGEFITWTYDSTYDRFYTDSLYEFIKFPEDNNTAGKIFLAGYDNVSTNLLLGSTGSLVSIGTSGRLSIKKPNAGTDAAAFKTAMSGIIIYLEAKEETTEQGTPFSENMDISDMGNMAWYSAYTDENINTLVAIPQGCKIFYPADYALFVDSLGQIVNWDAEKIVSTTQLQTALNNFLSSISGYDGTKNQTLKNQSGTFIWVDDE